MNPSLTVVKVGGSLFDLPDLGPRLESWRQGVGGPVLLVPGGGPTVDVIRDLDRRFQLGEEAAHWLALRAMTLNAHFLHALLPHAHVVATPQEALRLDPGILDAHAFALADEGQPGCLPHSWRVTSDSIAARVAVRLKAQRLVLLKSVTIAAETWRAAAAAGFVDPLFPEILAGNESLRVEAVNWRA